MISALKRYAETEPNLPGAAMVLKSAEYVEACKLIFEKGIPSKKIIRSMDSPVIRNIKKGFQFFIDQVTFYFATVVKMLPNILGCRCCCFP